MKSEKTFGEKVIDFNKNLCFTGDLPENIEIMNPFRESELSMEVSSKFYRKFYSDTHKRYLILGINPGRFGAGVTGIPFTDTKRLNKACEIDFVQLKTHEISSVFIYSMIKEFGGVRAFYNKFYINSVCPLGFIKKSANASEKNYNYYDNKNLLQKAEPFILTSIQKQISFGIFDSVCFCLGRGKNFTYLEAINRTHGFFKKVIALEHPRYIMQYQSKRMSYYIGKYLENFQKYCGSDH